MLGVTSWREVRMFVAGEAGVRGKGVRSQVLEAVVVPWLIPILFLVTCGHLVPIMRTNGRKG